MQQYPSLEVNTSYMTVFLCNIYLNLGCPWYVAWSGKNIEQEVPPTGVGSKLGYVKFGHPSLKERNHCFISIS